MRPNPLLLGLALAPLAASGPLAPGPLLAEPIRSIQYEFPADTARALRWKTGSGAFTFGAWDEPSVLAEVRIHCAGTDEEACRREAETIQLEWLQKGDRIELGVGAPPAASGDGKGGDGKGVEAGPPPAPSALTIEGRLRVPAGLPLEVNLESGSVDVSGLWGDVAVELGSGDASLLLSRRRAGAVDLTSDTGTVELTVNGRRVPGDLEPRDGPRALHWKGEGRSAIKVKVGTGNARVRLEDGGKLEPGGGGKP
ncbi:MAG TPA: hypothetical protein VEL74_23905 [Thermoanaerobaculia bacterium]|nr:hypothetical protein [Thermoanaerobaculia bacterium]